MAAIALLALAVAAPAAAHRSGRGAEVLVERVLPRLPAVTVRSVPGVVGKVELANAGRSSVTVLGRRGQPLLRVGPRGVEANATSPEWYAANEPLGIAEVPPRARPGARPRWVRVSAVPRWEWFDHRFHPTATPRPGTWTIPLVRGRVRARVTGRVRPVPGSLAVRLAAARLPARVEVTPIDAAHGSGVGVGASLRLRNRGGRPVTVLGPDGEPFARLDRQGVEINLRSPASVPLSQARNRSLLEAVVDPDAAPRWVPLGPARELIWPDPRLSPERATPGLARIATVGRPIELRRWSIPLRTASGARSSIRGATLLDPERPGERRQRAPVRLARSDGGPPTGLIAVLAAVALLTGAALVVRGRRDRTHPAG